MSSEPTISIAASGNLKLTFRKPDINSLTPMHSVEIPNSERGLALLRHVLVARQSGASKLGQAGNPTQAMIQLWLQNKFEEDLLTKRMAEKEADDLVLAEF